MDPISLTASIIAILQLSSKVIAYLNDVKDASKDRAQCAIEATNLHSLLTILRFRLEEGGSNLPWYTTVRALGVENGPLDQFKRALELLQTKMTERKGGLLKKAGEALTWKFEKAEIASILSAMERLKTLVQVALEMDHFKLSLAIQQSADETQQKTEEIKDDTTSIRKSIPIINFKIDSLQEHGDLARRNMLIAWLSNLDFPTQQADIIGRKQEGTGQWFLDAREYVLWLSSPADKKTLFCPGMPGAGKTMIAAIAIDHLRKISSETTGVAYVFCNYKMQSEQTVSTLLAAMLKQLVQIQTSNLNHIARLHGQHVRQGTRPTITEIIDVLQTVVETFSTVYLVVDALDEFQDHNGARKKLIDHFQNLQKKSVIRLMITSRPLPSIVEEFKNGNTQKLEVRADDNDVKQFVAGQIYRLPKCIQRDVALQEIVQEKIVEAVNGMFLLALLHVDSLRDKRTKTKVQSTLETMRKGSRALDEAYDSAVERINCQLPDDTALAKRGLSWIINAVRPLTTTEICHALAVDLDTEETDLDPDNILDVDELVSVCAGLVIVDEESDVVRLVHYTTQEYFERIRERLVPNAQLEISSVCLIYLSFETFRNSGEKDHANKKWIKDSGLLGYAAQHWGEHARTVQIELCEQACLFLHDQPVLNCAMRVKLMLESNLSWGASQTTGLHLAAIFGLQHLTELLLSGEREKVMTIIDAPDDFYQTPLSLTAINGHKEVAAILIDNGANIEGKNSAGETPLQRAVLHEHEQVIELLLDRGADVDGSGVDWHKSPLQLATFQGHVQIVKLLLDKGADINKEDPIAGSAVRIAAYKGHFDLVQLLLDDGADMHAQSEEVGDALQSAAFGGQEHIVILLLKRGAKIDAQGGKYGTALQAASFQGHERIVDLLIERGADVTVEGGQYNTALQAASYRGQAHIVKMLIAKGADINARGGKHDSALQAAAYEGHTRIVRLLIDEGGDVNAQGGWHGNALQAASSRGYEYIIELLIDSGADVNVQGGYYGTALQAAAFGLQNRTDGGSSDFGRVVELLLEKGADVNTEGGNYGTALQAAVAGWNRGVVRLLLEKNANPNIKGGLSGSFLNDVALKGWKDILQLVHDRGCADLHALDWHGRNLLHLAAKGGDFDTFQYLIELGMDSTIEDAKGDGLLSYACLGGSLPIVNALLASNTPSIQSNCWNPLHWACKQGNGTIVERLLQEGVCSTTVHVLQPEGDWCPMSVAIYHHSRERLDSLKETLPNYEAHLSADEGTLVPERICEGKYSYETCSGCLCSIYGLRFWCRTCTGFKYCFMCKAFLDSVHEGHETACDETEEI